MALTSLLRHERRALAMKLVDRELRTSPIHSLTGLPEPEIRSLFKMKHDRSPPSGPMPSSSSFFTSRRNQAEVTLFGALYRHLGGQRIHRQLSAETLMKAHDLYREIHPEDSSRKGLNFTDAWVIARDLKSGATRFVPCRHCGLDYLIADETDIPPNCPFCFFRRLIKQKDGQRAPREVQA